MADRKLARCIATGALEVAFWAPFFFLPLAASVIVHVQPQAYVYAQALCGAAALAVVGAYLHQFFFAVRLFALIVLGVASVVAVGIGYARLGIGGAGYAYNMTYTMLAIMNSDVSESTEFIRGTYDAAAYVLAALVLFPLFPFITQWRKQLIWRARNATPGIILGSLSALYIFLRVGILGTPFTLTLAALPPPVGIYFAAISALQERAAIADIGANAAPIADVSAVFPQDKPLTHVIVIGEAESKYHMHLYGYGRRTTPLLDAMAKSGELLVFQDAVTSHAQTVEALTDALTVTTGSERERRTIIDVLNAAGFKTFWLSNQASKSGWDSAVALLTQSASEHRWVRNADLFPEKDAYAANDSSYQVDGALIPYLSDVLTRKEKHKVVFIHLIGSHYDYRRRYPPEMKIFSNLVSDCLDPKEADTVDDYDNSVHYTDLILNQIIDTMRNADGESLMIYFSDHGEEVYDFRKFFGHTDTLLSPYMAEVPLLVWLSPRYRQHHPEVAASAIASSSQPVSIADLSYTLADVAGVNFLGMDASRSFFSHRFVNRPRTTARWDYTAFRDTWRPDRAHANLIALNGCARGTRKAESIGR